MSRFAALHRFLSLPFILATFLALTGCESAQDPEVTGLAWRDYEESFAVSVGVDTVHVLLGTTAYPAADQPAAVVLDPEPVAGDQLRFRLRVVGLTLGQDVRAVTGYEWRGDTLRVWCGLHAPAKGNGAGGSAATDPWTPPYLVPRRMDIGAPANVEVRYIGQWYE